MLQIITYLLCIYLVYKALEILQIGLMSNRANRTIGIIIGFIAIFISLFISGIFVGMIDTQAHSVSNAMPK